MSETDGRCTPPADDDNRAPVSGGLDEGERSWGITRSNGATVYAERDVERILAARDAAWVERLAAVERERDEWGRIATQRLGAQVKALLSATPARREVGERIAQAIEAYRDATTAGIHADALTSDDGSGA